MQDSAMFSAVGTWVAAVGTWVAAFVSFAAAYLFYKNLIWLQRSQKSKEFANCAVAALNAAYTALTNGDPETVPPKAIRLNWLEAARQIEFYKKLKLKVTTSEYLALCGQAEAEARLKFHKSLNMYNIKCADYYANNEPLHPGKEVPTNSTGLHPVSLIVIYNFALKSIHSDPLDEVDIIKLHEEVGICKGNPGLKIYMQSAEVQEILEDWLDKHHV